MPVGKHPWRKTAAAPPPKKFQAEPEEQEPAPAAPVTNPVTADKVTAENLHEMLGEIRAEIEKDEKSK
jgi:hypothetical protein